MLSFQALITTAMEQGASDLHLSVGLPPCIRVSGTMHRLEQPPCQPEEIQDLAFGLMSEHHLRLLEEHGEVDFSQSLPNLGRFRLNVFRQKGSLALAVRILNPKIPSPRELGIPASVVQLADLRRGLVLVTGATGSGKSTTLASMIDLINQRHNYHIITLEDPIEYLHQHNRSIVNQREMGADSKSYAASLRAALRQDPDVILVGEMRDLETIATAVTAAETGHLVFSTLHTNGAANAIDRIIDVFPPHQQQQIRTQLADVLQCVVSQQLLPRQDGRGRVAAFEVMLANNAIRNHIREAKTFQIPTVMQTNARLGMKTMDDALYDLVLQNLISQESAMLFAQDKTLLSKRFL